MDPIIIGFTALGASIIAVYLNWQTTDKIRKISEKSNTISDKNANHINQKVAEAFTFNSTDFFKKRLGDTINSYTNAETNNLKRAYYAARSDLESLKEKLQEAITEEQATEIRKKIKISEERLEKIQLHRDLTNLVIQTVDTEINAANYLDENKEAILKELNKD